MAPINSANSDTTAPPDRQNWLAVLARASLDDLERAWIALPEQPAFRWLRPPDTGLIQVRGRAGGAGQPFNLGEATVTRCTVQLESGGIGVGYVMGRDGDKAALVAVFDALLQQSEQGPALRRDVVDPLARQQAEQRRRDAEATAATKVDFFTMVRGDD